MNSSTLYILLLFLSIASCATVSVNNETTIFSTMLPTGSEEVTVIIWRGDFEESIVVLKGKARFGNGTAYDIAFRLISPSLAILLSSPGIMRNGFANGTLVSFCDALAVDWCNDTCEAAPTCTPCLGCPQTPQQSLANDAGPLYCSQASADALSTFNGLNNPAPIIVCEKKAVQHLVTDCCLGVTGAITRAACLNVITSANLGVHNTISNSRLELFQPNVRNGAGVIHVSSPLHDFYIQLEPVEVQTFPTDIGETGDLIFVFADQERASRRIDDDLVIANDLANQISGDPTYLLEQSDFCHYERDNAGCQGPIREDVGNPNLFTALTSPTNRVTFFEINGCVNTYKADIVGKDMRAMLSADVRMIEQFPEFTFKTKCREDASAICVGNVTTPPSCAEGIAFFGQCGDLNLNIVEPHGSEVTFNFPGLNIAGIVNEVCNVQEVVLLGACVVQGGDSSGVCNVRVVASGEGSITFETVPNVLTGIQKRTVFCTDFADLQLLLIGKNTNKPFPICWYPNVNKVSLKCLNASVNRTFRPTAPGAGGGEPVFTGPTAGAPNDGSLSILTIIIIVAVAVAVLLILALLLPIFRGVGTSVGGAISSVTGESTRLVT